MRKMHGKWVYQWPAAFLQGGGTHEVLQEPEVLCKVAPPPCLQSHSLAKISLWALLLLQAQLRTGLDCP